MSKINLKTVLLLTAALAVLIAASCLKVKNPAPVKPNPNLTNHYCNDPNAINYNWGFPGIPDSSVCIYPVDPFLGKWQLVDSVFHSDSTFNYVDTQTITFESTDDTLHEHLKITGLCNGGNTFLTATANKYRQATIDSMDNHTAGQLFCSPTDTISGEFQFLFSAKDTMSVRLTVLGSNSGYHKGFAKKL